MSNHLQVPQTYQCKETETTEICVNSHMMLPCVNAIVTGTE